MTQPAQHSIEGSTAKAVEQVVQPQIYGLGSMGVPAVRKKPVKAPAVRPPAKTPEGDGPFELVDTWSKWMKNETGIPAPKLLKDRLMAEVKVLILEGYGSADLKWALAIWSTKLATNLNTSPKELPMVAWKYRMDTSQAGTIWREKMKQKAREMGQQGIAPSALAGSAAEQKIAATRSTANAWAQRQREKEARR